jgi:hypothetical protein
MKGCTLISFCACYSGVHIFSDNLEAVSDIQQVPNWGHTNIRHRGTTFVRHCDLTPGFVHLLFKQMQRFYIRIVCSFLAVPMPLVCKI